MVLGDIVHRVYLHLAMLQKSSMQTESEEEPKGPPAASNLTFSIAKIMEPDPRPRLSHLESAFKKYVPMIQPQSLLQHYPVPVLYCHPGYYLPLTTAGHAHHAHSALDTEQPSDTKESSDTKANNRHKTFTCSDCGKVYLMKVVFKTRK